MDDGSVRYTEGSRELHLRNLKIRGKGQIEENTRKSLRWSDGSRATADEVALASHRAITALMLITSSPVPGDSTMHGAAFLPGKWKKFVHG
jgi:hypothetical protein